MLILSTDLSELNKTQYLSYSGIIPLEFKHFVIKLVLASHNLSTYNQILAYWFNDFHMNKCIKYVWGYYLWIIISTACAMMRFCKKSSVRCMTVYSSVGINSERKTYLFHWLIKLRIKQCQRKCPIAVYYRTEFWVLNYI